MLAMVMIESINKGGGPAAAGTGVVANLGLSLGLSCFLLV